MSRILMFVISKGFNARYHVDELRGDTFPYFLIKRTSLCFEKSIYIYTCLWKYFLKIILNYFYINFLNAKKAKFFI